MSQSGYVIIRDGAVVLTVATADASDGYVGVQQGRKRLYVLDGVLLERAGLKAEAAAAVKRDPSLARTQYEAYLYRPSVPTESGAVAVPLAEWEAGRRRDAEAAMAEALAGDRKPGNNRKTRTCERCGSST